MLANTMQPRIPRSARTVQYPLNAAETFDDKIAQSAFSAKNWA